MKAYVKPAMMALSISANDMLCTGCAEGTKNNKMLSGMLEEQFEGNSGITPDQFFTEEEANAVGAFGSSEAQCTVPVEIGKYCKYTAVENNMVGIFNS